MGSNVIESQDCHFLVEDHPLKENVMFSSEHLILQTRKWLFLIELLSISKIN